MDEKVINDLYSHATSKGYKKDINEFKTLIQTNETVLNDMYSYVQGKGYKKDINSFSQLVGKQVTPAPTIEKKNPVQSANALPNGGENATISSTETALPSTVSASELEQRPAPTPLASTRMPQAPTSDPNLIARQQEQQIAEQQRNAQQIQQGLQQQAFNEVPTNIQPAPTREIQFNQIQLPKDNLPDDAPQPAIHQTKSSIDQFYLELDPESKKEVDITLESIYTDLYANNPNKSSVTKEDVLAKIDEKFGVPQTMGDVQKRNAVLEQVVGDESIMDNRFEKKRNEYLNTERDERAEKVLENDFGKDFEEPLFELNQLLGFNEEIKGVNRISKTKEEVNAPTSLGVGKAKGTDLSDNLIKFLADNGDFIKEGKAGSMEHGGKTLGKDANGNYILTNGQSVTFEEIKDLYNRGLISFDNPFNNPIANAYVNEKIGDYTKQKANNSIKSEISEMAGGDFDRLPANKKVESFIKISEKVDSELEKTSEFYTPAEKLIKKGYDKLISINNQIKDVDDQIAQLNESRGSISREELASKLEVLNAKKEFLQESLNSTSQTVSKYKESVLGYKTELFDPLTGKQINQQSQTPESSKWNEQIQQKTSKYLEGYKGSLQEAKVKEYYRFKQLQEAVLSQERLKEYHSDVKAGKVPYDFFNSSDKLFLEYQDAAAELKAIARAEVLNIDVKDLPRSKADAFMEGMMGGIGADRYYKSNIEVAQDFVKSAKENGVKVSKDQEKRIVATTGENIMGGLGSSVPVLVELAVSTASMNALGVTGAITSGFNVLRGMKAAKDSATFIKTLNVLEKAVKSGVNFQTGGQDFLTGVGEGVGQSISDGLGDMGYVMNLFGKSKLGKVLNKSLSYTAKRAMGATGETLSEYLGEFTSELYDNGFEDALKTTIGNDPFEKFITTMAVSSIFSIGTSLGDITTAEKKEFDTKVREQFIKEYDTYVNKGKKPSEEATKAYEEAKADLLAEREAVFMDKNNFKEGTLTNPITSKTAETSEPISKTETTEISEPMAGETPTETPIEVELSTTSEPKKTNINPIIENIEGEPAKYTDSEGFDYQEKFLISMIENGDEKVNGILLTNPSPEVVAALEKTKEVAPEMGTTETVTEMGTEEAPVVAETLETTPIEVPDKLQAELDVLGIENQIERLEQEKLNLESDPKSSKTDKDRNKFMLESFNNKLNEAKNRLDEIVSQETTPQATPAGETQSETVQVEAPPITVIPQTPAQTVPTPQGFDTKLKELGYSDTDISSLTFEQKQDIVTNQTQKAEVTDSAKLPETKPTLTEGSVVDLPPLIAGGQARVMTYKDGKWVQKIGGIESNVSEKVQQEAQQKWNEENGLSTPIDSKAKDITPETKVDETKAPELPKEIEKRKANLMAEKLRERAAKMREASGGTLTVLPSAIAKSMEGLAFILDKVGDIQQGIAEWRKTDDYKNLSKEDKSEADSVANELLGVVESEVETKPQPKKEEPKKPASEGGEKSKISRQTRRAAELSNDELASELKEIGKYKPTSFEEVSKNVDSVIELVGAEEAIILASVPGNMSEDLAIAVLTEASALVAREARIEVEKARKKGDVEAEQRALKKERDALVAANAASQKKTKMGAIISYTQESYKKYPDIYANKLVQEFSDANSAPLSQDYGTEGKTLGEEIETVREGVAKGVSDVVDSVLDNEALLQKIADLEAELEKAKTESGKAKTEKKNKELKKKASDLRKSGLAKLRHKPSPNSTISGSFIGLSNEQLTGIKEIIQSFVIGGYANTSIIINKTYNFIKENIPDLSIKKDTLREIAKEIAEFNTMLSDEVYAKDKRLIESLEKKLKDLQDRIEVDKESVSKEPESDRVKELRKQISEEQNVIRLEKILSDLETFGLQDKTASKKEESERITSLKKQINEKVKILKLEKELNDLYQGIRKESKQRDNNDSPEVKALKEEIAKIKKMNNLIDILAELEEGVLRKSNGKTYNADPDIKKLQDKIKEKRKELELEERIQKEKMGIDTSKPNQQSVDSQKIKDLKEELNEIRTVKKLLQRLSDLDQNGLPKTAQQKSIDSKAVSDLKNQINEKLKVLKLEEKIAQLKSDTYNPKTNQTNDSKQVAALKDIAKREKELFDLRQKLKDLQEGKESVDLRVKPEDSPEVKALKEEIAKEREITPKKLKEMVKDHYLGKNPGSRTLAEAIANKTGKKPSEVQALADAIEADINEKLNRMVDAEVKKFIDKAADTPKNKTLKELRDKQRIKGGLSPDEQIELDRRLETLSRQKEINKIVDILKKGNLKSSNEFAQAFEKRFKFKTLSDEAKGTILQIQNRLAELAQRANDIEKKILVGGKEEVVRIQRQQRAEVSRLTKELSTVLESQRPSTYASFLMATLGTSYTFMLSSLTTLYNALKGGLASGALDTVIYSIANARSAVKVIANPTGGMWAALRRAGNAAATGMDLFGENVMKGEYNSSYFSASERKLLKGLNQAIRDKDTKAIVGKLMGSILKNIHLLGGIDALQSSLGANFITSVENVKAARRGAETIVKEKYRQEALSDGETADEAESYASQKMKESEVKSEVKQKESEMVKDYFERAKALREEYTIIAKEEYQSDLQNVKDEVDELIKLRKIESKDKDRVIREKMSEIVGLTTSKIEPEAHYVSTRVRELIEIQNEKIFQAALSVVKESTMQSLPDGILGRGVSAMQRYTALNREDNPIPATMKFVFNLLFKFQRLTALELQKKLYSIPLMGIAFATIGVGRDVNTGEFIESSRHDIFAKYNANPLLAKQRIYKNLVITAASMIALALMYDFDDDDDETGLLSDFLGGPSRWKLDPNRPIDVRGFGYGDARDKKTSSNYLPLSFSLTKDEKGKFINYNETKQIPELSTIISFLGTFSDDTKGETEGFERRFDNSFLRYYLNTALNTAGSTLESSFNSFGKLNKAYKRGKREGGDSGAGLSEMASSFVAGELATLTNPAIVRDLTEVAKASVGAPKTDSYATFLSKVLATNPLLDWTLPNATDQFGNEIPQDVSLKKVIPWKYKEEMKDNPKFRTTVGLMYKFGKGLEIPYESMPEMKKNAEFKTSFKSNSGTTYNYTYEVKDSEIQKEAQDKYKEELKTLMDKSFDKLDKIDNYEDLNEAVGKIRTKAKDNTEMYIIKKYKDDETKIIKK